MRQAVIAMTFALATVAATPARAAIFTYVVTGSVVGDASENGAVFGEEVIGRAFTARFEVDDGAPLALYAADANGSSARGGGLVQDGTRPPLNAVLTVNGIDYAIRTGDKDVPPYCIPDAGCFGPSSRIDDAGGVVKDAAARRLALFAGYDSYDGCCADYGSYYRIATDDLRFALDAAAFVLPDYRQTGSFAVSGTGSFAAVFSAGDRSGGVDAATRLTLAPTSLQVTGGAVPEPATWAMMILGFALTGAAMRGRRIVAAAR